MDKQLQISILNEIYGSLLTTHQREIIKSHYDYDMSLSEIAINFNISRQAVSDAIKKGCESLYNFEDKLKIYNTLTEVKGGLEDALSSLENGQLIEVKTRLEQLLKDI